MRVAIIGDMIFLDIKRDFFGGDNIYRYLLLLINNIRVTNG